MDYLNYAGFGWRVLASLIDSTILALLGCLAGLGIGLAMTIALLSTGMDKHAAEMIVITTCRIVGIILSWLYYTLLESSPWQATVGKKVCGLTVTDSDGEPISFGRANGRYWGKILSSITCCAGYVMAGFTARKQALHDKIANTLVLRNVD